MTTHPTEVLPPVWNPWCRGRSQSRRLRAVWLSAALMAGSLVWLSTVPSAVFADAAPPAPPPGSNLGPGESVTNVRMMTETVIVAMRAMTSTDLPGDRYDSRPVFADVSAHFLMRNLGDAEDRMAVRFPLEDPGGKGDGYGEYPLITDFQVAVDGQKVPSRRITTPNPSDYPSGPDPIDWAEFDVRFLPAVDVRIDVAYSQQAYRGSDDACFSYVLQTGAGWRDSIGSADIIFRLPYRADPMVMARRAVYPSWTINVGDVIRDGTAMGYDMQFHFDDLEPTPQDDLWLCAADPFHWQWVASAKERLALTPGQPSALHEVALSLKAMGTGMYHPKARSVLLVDDLDVEVRQAFEAALAADPDDPSLHAAYADYQWDGIFWRAIGHQDLMAADSRLASMVEHLQMALRLDPRQPDALRMLRDDPSTRSVEGEDLRGLLDSLPDPGLLVPYLTTEAPTPRPAWVSHADRTATAGLGLSGAPQPSATPAARRAVIERPTPALLATVPTNDDESVPAQVAGSIAPAGEPPRPPLSRMEQVLLAAIAVGAALWLGWRRYRLRSIR